MPVLMEPSGPQAQGVTPFLSMGWLQVSGGRREWQTGADLCFKPQLLPSPVTSGNLTSLGLSFLRYTRDNSIYVTGLVLGLNEYVDVRCLDLGGVSAAHTQLLFWPWLQVRPRDHTQAVCGGRRGEGTRLGLPLETVASCPRWRDHLGPRRAQPVPLREFCSLISARGCAVWALGSGGSPTK